jgi:hypothetical protein
VALTEYQRKICRLIAANRKEQGAAYVAGGVALNTLIDAPRVSLDIDLFHDTDEALDRTWVADRALLLSHGYGIEVLRERTSFVEAMISLEQDEVLMQWARDSAFRFFPLVEDEDFGLTLHPFDLATNKVLALASRLEVRDWIDLINCHDKIQPLGYLVWSACGKDPGFNPKSLLLEAARTSRYSTDEVSALSFDGPVPDAGELSRRWHEMLKEAKLIVDRLPIEEADKCVLDSTGALFTGGIQDLEQAIDQGGLLFHTGNIQGALPRIVHP